MREYLLTAALSAVFCFMLTPLVRKLAMNSGAFIELRSRDAGSRGNTGVYIGILPLRG